MESVAKKTLRFYRDIVVENDCTLSDKDLKVKGFRNLMLEMYLKVTEDSLDEHYFGMDKMPFPKEAGQQDE